MRQLHQLNDNEKELLTVLGKYPQIPLKELLSLTSYRWASTIAKKIEQFKELKIVVGPTYFADHTKLCRNPLHRLLCVLESNKSYEAVLSYLKLIEPLMRIYPVLSQRVLLIAGYLSSDNQKVQTLFQLLKDNDIITDYSLHVRQHYLVQENPDFFGDPLPSLNNLLDLCDVPDRPFGNYEIELSECDIRTLSYLQGEYESPKLIEILRKERKLHDRKWTYEQIKYSFRKLVNNKLIERKYFISPFPLTQCADFYMFLKTDDPLLTKRILHNFGRGGRLYREYVLCDDGGMIGCLCHPVFLTDLMLKLDKIEEIREKKLYHLRSFPPGILYVGENAELDHYDVDTQTLVYPYHLFRERIKKKIEMSE
ncbi:MAG: hypothetical protein HXS44_01250 [Theionarchaea archaeon]|nr:hypothetical protein [Theionarchaea archaeon]